MDLLNGSLVPVSKLHMFLLSRANENFKAYNHGKKKRIWSYIDIERLIMRISNSGIINPITTWAGGNLESYPMPALNREKKRSVRESK